MPGSLATESNQPMTSIVMPVRNDETTLEDCLQSILHQTQTNWELIVVDDGSTDRSPQVLAAYAQRDARVRIFRTPPQGIVSALNLGLEHTRGHYIARMDGDDLMLPTRLESQQQFLESHPQIDLIGSLVQGLPHTTLYHEWHNRLLTDAEIKTEIFAECPLLHPTFFAKQEFFKRLKGYAQVPWAEDYDLVLRAYRQGAAFGKVPEVLLKKRDLPQRLSRTDPLYKRPAMFRAKAHYFQQEGFPSGKSSILIAGTGPTGRQLAVALQEYQIPLAGFVDNRVGPPNRTVMGLPAYGFPHAIPQEFLQQMQNCFLALAVGENAGQAALIAQLEQHEWQCGQDFLRFI